MNMKWAIAGSLGCNYRACRFPIQYLFPIYYSAHGILLRYDSYVGASTASQINGRGR